MEVIASHCPWYGFYKAWGAPDIHYCEALVCGIVNSPSLAFSNFLYIVLGLISYSQVAHKCRKLSIVLILMGICSFFYHSTNNGFTQFFDLFAIYIFLSLVYYFNKIRMNDKNTDYLFIPLIILSASFFIFRMLGIPVQFTVGLFAPYLVYQEVKQIKQDYRLSASYFYSIALLVLATISNALDVTKVACNPDNHFFQFHSLWHILSALGVYFYIKHLDELQKQFYFSRKK